MHVCRGYCEVGCGEMLGDVVGCCDGCDIVMVGRVGRWDVVGCCDG